LVGIGISHQVYLDDRAGDVGFAGADEILIVIEDNGESDLRIAEYSREERLLWNSQDAS